MSIFSYFDLVSLEFLAAGDVADVTDVADAMYREHDDGAVTVTPSAASLFCFCFRLV
jgi:hypothetical protein